MTSLSRLSPKSFWACLLACVLALVLLTGSATTSPLPDSDVTRALSNVHLVDHYNKGAISQKKPETVGPATSDYPTDDQINALWKAPKKNRFVFWTEINDPRGSALARAFAASIEGVVITDCFPYQFICELKRSDGWYMNFVDRISGVYSDHVRGTVYVVTDSMNGLKRKCSTFQRVELPTLRDIGMTEIIFVNAHDFNDRKTKELSNRELKEKRNGGNETLSERDSINIPTCLNWDGYGDDPNGYCYPLSPGPPYSAGQCGIHVVQTRANNEGLSPVAPVWYFDVSLKDANGEQIGYMRRDMIGGETFSIKSALPWTFSFSPGLHGYGDESPIALAYAAWGALTEAPACSVGAYDNGKRQIDCGFPCA